MSGILCDFIFQHKYGKRWISYTDSEIDRLNIALKRNQKTVTLPSKDSKKRITVNFETMIQKNMVSNVEQSVRAVIFSKDFQAWMWKNENNEFSSFRPFQIYYLEAAFQHHLTEVRFYNSGDYTVDLRNFTLIQESSNNVTPIVRETVTIVRTSVIADIARQSNSLSAKMCQSDFVRSLCEERRIFDPMISPVKTSVKSTRSSLPANFFSTEKQLQSISSEQMDSSHIYNTCVDKECPNADEFKLFSSGEMFYSATLSYTSLEENINKYLVMQVLLDESNHFFLWQRWGRIGYKSQTNLSKFGSKLKEAKAKFEEKFYEKTKNNWHDVHNFRQVSGKYDLLQMDLSVDVVEEKSDFESLLPSTTQFLLSLITSRKMMNQIMTDMSYDLIRVPLGKLSVSQIKEGYSALNKIAVAISSGGSGKDLINACDEFYTKIPHNFRRKAPPIISTAESIEEKLKLLEALLNINIAVNVINQVNTSVHPLDKCYESLDCLLEPIDLCSKEFLVIQESLFGTHGPTHRDYEMEIINVFACSKTAQALSSVGSDNKLLLWHGSRLTNWIGILKEGLRIAPREAPSSGAMFGKGLYFADASSKSANYCHATKKQNMGILLLCEVQLGKSLLLYDSIHNIRTVLHPDYDSVIGKGRFVPTIFSDAFSNDIKIPMGPLVEEKEAKSSLMYNEYIVYNTSQAKMKYLILVKFNFK